jgi:hypothetical protein
MIRALKIGYYALTGIALVIGIVVGYNQLRIWQHSGQSYISEFLRLALVCLFCACVFLGGVAHYAATRLERARATQKATLTGTSKLVIHSALYGTGQFDDVVVTDKLNSIARDALVIPVDNNLVPFDPAPNKEKRLQVEYSYDNPAHHIVTRQEYSRLVLPEDSEISRLTSEAVQQRRASPEQIGKAGALMCRAGDAEALAQELERIWHVFDDEGAEKLVHPLRQGKVPDTITEWRHKELWKFRVIYKWHIDSVKELDGTFRSAVIDHGFPNSDKYLDVKRNLKEHGVQLRKYAEATAKQEP